MDRRTTLAVVLTLLVTAGTSDAQSLNGSPAAMKRQHAAAVAAGSPFHETVASVYSAIVTGELLRVTDTEDYRLHRVSFPYARAETVRLLEHLAAEYRGACGQRLVVTSLTRPRVEQPRNGSRRSVHPAGLAIDMRRSERRSCRRWLENTLLDLEQEGLVEATRERWPPHYHVAVIPAGILARWPDAVVAAGETAPLEAATYEVHPGDTLWEIARELGSSTSLIRAASGLRSARIYPGQVLEVPITDRTDETGS